MMANFMDMQHAAIRHLQTMPALPNVGYPNRISPELPRFIIQTGMSGSNETYLNASTDAQTELAVLVETEDGDFANQNDTLVSALLDHFKAGTRFEGMMVPMAPTVKPPVPGTGAYTVPVLIRIRDFF